MKRVVVLLLALFLFAPPVLAQEPGKGAINGQVVNKTPGTGVVAQQPVDLITYQGGAEKGRAKVNTDAEGRFAFGNLATASTYSYTVSVTYQDNEYQSESITFASGETAKTVEVTVYESTTSDENVKVEANYVVIFPEKGQLQVRELVRIVNTGDHTYVGSKVMEADPTKKETLRFLLPDSARELSYDQGLMECCVFKAEQGFVDTMGVLPGVKEIDFGYRLPYSPPQYDFLKTVAYPTDDLVVLIHGTGVQATSSDLVEEGPTDLGGDQFLVLSRADVGKDTQITTTLYGLPQGDSQKALRWAGTTLAVLAAGFGLGYPILRRRQKRAGGEDRQLLLELASLDDAFAAGSIAEEEYRRLRAEKKEQLLQQWRGSSRDNL